MPSGVSWETGGLADDAAALIADAIEGAFERAFGVGPSSIEMVGSDWFVTALLYDVFGAEERALVAAGRFAEVRERRRERRERLTPGLCATVEWSVDAPVACMI